VTYSVDVEALEGSLGARVHGVDARRPIGSNDLAMIRRALLDRRVLFFRGQDLSAEEHLAFAAQFGVLSVDPVSRLAGRPKVLSYIEEKSGSEFEPAIAQSFVTMMRALEGKVQSVQYPEPAVAAAAAPSAPAIPEPATK